MIKISDTGDDQHANLFKALLFYGSSNNVSFATLHDIEQGIIMPGKAVSMQDIAALIREPEQPKPSLIHPRVVASSRNTLVWWKPAGFSSVIFKSEQPQKSGSHRSCSPFANGG
ncbi:MAG: hypothetical protein NVV63_12490 [Opitutus sp.]|nr:hypothetical protein [Opitutus sp.]